MLSLLHIENVAVVERADISFEPGFCVLTGETGAGKSIIIDSINMVLGERTSRDLIRNGQEKAYVCASFGSLGPAALKQLQEQGFAPDEDGNLLLEREITTQGKGWCKVGGRPVSTGALKSLAVSLINIHGQHDSQSLLQSENHLGYLDAYIGSEKLLAEYRTEYDAMKDAEKQLQALQTNESERERRLDVLRFQTQELEQADLSPGEDEELEARREKLANSEKIAECVQQAYSMLYEGDEDMQSVHDLLATSLEAVTGVARFSENLEKCRSVLENMSYELEDLTESLRDEQESIDFDPSELEELEDRLALIRTLKRKYGATIDEILEFYSNAAGELDLLENSGKSMEKLQKAYDIALSKTAEKGRKLHEYRLKEAKKLADKIEQELHFLSMENARFDVRVEQHTDCEGNPIYRPSGGDDVVFLMTTNKGEPLKELSKIASGGELSRIMLALKNVMTRGDTVGTLIFDEIDTGISGRAASRVAQKMREISHEKQVLCVSHLVAIAAAAQAHYLISKDDSSHTRTTVTLLHGDDRVQEIARLIGGEDITATTLANARELLEHNEQ